LDAEIVDGDASQGEVGALGGELTGLDGKITGLDGKITGLDGKITGLRAEVTANFVRLDERLTTALDLRERIVALEARLAG